MIDLAVGPRGRGGGLTLCSYGTFSLLLNWVAEVPLKSGHLLLHSPYDGRYVPRYGVRPSLAVGSLPALVNELRALLDFGPPEELRPLLEDFLRMAAKAWARRETLYVQ